MQSNRIDEIRKTYTFDQWLYPLSLIVIIIHSSSLLLLLIIIFSPHHHHPLSLTYEVAVLAVLALASHQAIAAHLRRMLSISIHCSDIVSNNDNEEDEVCQTFTASLSIFRVVKRRARFVALFLSNWMLTKAQNNANQRYVLLSIVCHLMLANPLV